MVVYISAHIHPDKVKIRMQTAGNEKGNTAKPLPHVRAESSRGQLL